jgi:DNA mismatch endonuclease (patch repair protein)
MRGNKRRDTLPEMQIRRLVHSAGLRYRVDHPPLQSQRRLRADLVFTRLKIAVFIDGCFWHGCPRHYKPSRTNTEYWTNKIENNRARDARTDEQLKISGWSVLRFWAHVPPDVAAQEIVALVRARQSGMAAG